jgi:methylenetetrahydrofolate reductase (NADPH)
MTVIECWTVLEAKVREIESRGMAALVVTQFSFDPDACLAWLKELRARGINCPVRLGVPGPAGIKRLLAYAARCGVGASATVMKKYGISLTNLLGTAGPDKLVNDFTKGLSNEHGRVRLHFYPFGGMTNTLEWISAYGQKYRK